MLDLAVSLLAVAEPNNFGDTRSGTLAGPMALFIILVLATGMVLLVRNMNKRLRRLPASFEEKASDATDVVARSD